MFKIRFIVLLCAAIILNACSMFGKKDKNTGGLDEGTPKDSLSVEEFSIDTTQTDSTLFNITSNDSVELDIDEGVIDINSLFEEFDSEKIATNLVRNNIIQSSSWTSLVASSSFNVSVSAFFHLSTCLWKQKE